MVVSKIAVFDLDGTLFRWQLFYELQLELVDEGFFSPKTTKALQDAFFAWQSRTGSFRDFEQVAVPAMDERIRHISVKDFEAMAKHVVERSSHKVYRYTRELAASLKQDGYHLLALSGSHQEIAEPFSKVYGFDACIGCLYEREGDKYTGTILRRPFGRKAELLKEYAEINGFSMKGSVAIGDSHGDIDMLEMVDRPIAFNPSEELLEIALAKGWEVVVERKNIAYHLQKDSHGSVVLAKTDTY